MKALVAGGIALLFLSAAVVPDAAAVPTVFFGEDLTPGGVVPPGGNAETARGQFLAGLVGVGNEDFEGIPVGTIPPIALAFPGSGGTITATLSSISGGVCDTVSGTVGGIDCNGFGRFPTSGDQWLHTSTEFTIAFSSPVAAFGFYGTDIGDFSGQVTLTLTGGSVVTLTIPTTISGPDGSLVFWGFIDPAASYSSIAFGNTSGGSDVFGFDDMVIGDQEQVQPAVPEPATLLLLGSGIAGLALRRRRRS